MDLDSKEIITDVAVHLIKDAGKSAWEKVNQFFKGLDAKESIKYGLAYENYLFNTMKKNSKIKTIIFCRVPKDLYSFYECIGVQYNGKLIDTKSIVNLVEKENRIIITGVGGIGKSILFKHLFLNTIEETNYIPVLIELRSFNILETKDISLFEYIYKSLLDNGFYLEKKYFEYSLKEGGYVILLDGYDEVNREKAAKITSEIKTFCDKYAENKYIVSSRPTEEFIGWNDFAEMMSKPLTKEQALRLINRIEFDDKVKDIFYKELDENLYDKYKSFASNPLLLNIMLLTFNKHASIPDKLNDFYEQAFVTLYNTHDATKDSYVRDIRTGLGCEDFKMIFAYICFKSYFNSEYEFSETKLRKYLQLAREKFEKIKFSIEDFHEDLTLTVCMLVKDGLNYRFSHRSFQEYFAAWYTCKLPDETQSRLLINWIKEADNIPEDSYFTMLFNLQEEKVNKIILCPGLKRIQKLYEEDGFTLEFLSKLVNGVYFTPNRLENKQINGFAMSLEIEDMYLGYTLTLTCRLNEYVYPPNNNKINEIIYFKLKNKNRKDEKTKEIYMQRRKWSFQEMLEIMTEIELLESMKWFENQIFFGISVIEKNNNYTLNKKRKVSSIIDEL